MPTYRMPQLEFRVPGRESAAPQVSSIGGAHLYPVRAPALSIQYRFSMRLEGEFLTLHHVAG